MDEVPIAKVLANATCIGTINNNEDRIFEPTNVAIIVFGISKDLKRLVLLGDPDVSFIWVHKAFVKRSLFRGIKTQANDLELSAQLQESSLKGGLLICLLLRNVDEAIGCATQCQTETRD